MRCVGQRPCLTLLVAFASPLHSSSTDARSPRTLDRSADPVDTSRHRHRCKASPSSESSLPLPLLPDPSLSIAFGKRDSQL